MKIKRGITRIVFLVGPYALKIPNFYSYTQFLHGLLANMQERRFSNSADMIHKLCPVLASDPFGFFVVMPRVETFADEQITYEEMSEFCHEENFSVPAEKKADSFGIFNGNLVAVDYG